jgi:hypothetical protein
MAGSGHIDGRYRPILPTGGGDARIAVLGHPEAGGVPSNVEQIPRNLLTLEEKTPSAQRSPK